MSVDVKEKEVQEALEKKEYWWWAEKARSQRMDYLRKAVWSKATKGSSWLPGVEVCTEGLRWFTKGFKEADPAEEFIITRANAFALLLDNIPIFIVDQSRIVGYPGSAPHRIHWIPTQSYTVNDDIFNDRTGILREEDRLWIGEALDWWQRRTYQAKCEKYLSRRERMLSALSIFVAAGRHLTAFDYVTPQPDWMFGKGLEGIIETIDGKLSEANRKLHEDAPDATEQVAYLQKIDTWTAMKICLEAVIRYARRYSRLAKIIAENFETDPTRKQELLRISETCYKVPAQPPEHFWEAIQFEHFVQIAYRYEWHNAAWSSRYDYWLWPFYKKDVIDEKSMTREDVVEYCMEWMIRAYEVGKTWLRFGREAMQGTPGPYVWTIGGVDEEGGDACNDLTDCFLEAARLTRVCDPTFGFRYHPGARLETLRQVFECIRHGLGYPSIRNDSVLIPNIIQWFGHPLNEARRWVHQACMAPAPDTMMGAPPLRYPSASLFGGAKAVEFVLFNGWDPLIKMQLGVKSGEAAGFKTFDEFYNAWLEQMKDGFNVACRIEHINRHVEALHYPKPMTSALYQRCVESGENSALSKERSSLWFTLFAFGDTGDSLAAVKKLVFDEKKYTVTQLIEALKVNWDGYEEMRMDFVKAPKWGNDDDYVDQIWVRIYNDLRKLSWSARDWCGSPWGTLPESVATHIVQSTKIGALPNGRRWGDPLYDGGCSPGAGQDKKGPTAVLRSVGKIDHVGTVRGSLLNQRLSPTQLAGEKGFQLWLDYIKTWHDLGINHVQFNMVDNETLYAAQREPEKFSELIVRIAGYSAHFVEMNKKTQDSIIARQVQAL
jgi:formate C-acetyltransferase/benzylsuccinate synthase